VHGILRTLLLVPMMGDFPARQISVFTGSLLIFGVTLLFIKWIAARTRLQLLIVGTIWVLLTILFEITLGRLVLGLSWDRITENITSPVVASWVSGYCSWQYLRSWRRRSEEQYTDQFIAVIYKCGTITSPPVPP
jgi:hypothetical protein